MRVGLDVRYLSHGLFGGVHGYVLQLASELPRAGADVEFVYYADTKAGLDLAPLPANVELRLLPWSSPLSSVLNDRRLASAMRRDRVELAHFPANHGARTACPMVVTMHDAIPFLRLGGQLRPVWPSPRRLAVALYLALRARRTARVADLFIAPSEHARGDLVARAGLAGDRVVAVHNAVSAAFRPLSDDDVRAGLPPSLRELEPFLLADAVKNPELLLAAWRSLAAAQRERTPLVFFCRHEEPPPAVARALGAPGLHLVPRPDQPTLVCLMNRARAFVFPSFWEGFGMPVVEAMRCGTPVLASDRGSVPEIAGGAALFFDADSASSLARQLEAFLGSDDLARRLREQGLRRAAAFDWRVTAERTLEVYRRLLALEPRSRAVAS